MVIATSIGERDSFEKSHKDGLVQGSPFLDLSSVLG